jgi:hypothetical protein
MASIFANGDFAGRCVYRFLGIAFKNTLNRDSLIRLNLGKIAISGLIFSMRASMTVFVPANYQHYRPSYSRGGGRLANYAGNLFAIENTMG